MEDIQEEQSKLRSLRSLVDSRVLVMLLPIPSSHTVEIRAKYSTTHH